MPKEISKEELGSVLIQYPLDLVDNLASSIHDAWWVEKIKQGFHHPRKTHNDWTQSCGKICDKCHLDMIEYDKLAPEHQKYDKITIETVLVGLDRLGYKLV